MIINSMPAMPGNNEALKTHVNDMDNPHRVTADQTGAVPATEKGIAGGVAILDTNGKVPLEQLPEMYGGELDLGKLSPVQIGVDTTANASYPAVGIGSNVAASGPYSIAMGYNVNTQNQGSIALGRSTSATGFASIALGLNATSIGNYSIAMGQSSRVSGCHAITMGHSSMATGNNTITIGYGASSSGNNSIALGHRTTASGHGSLAWGASAKSSGFNSIALGHTADAYGNNSIALGFTAAAVTSSIAIGYSAHASGNNSVAIGMRCSTQGSNSAAIGIESHTYAYEKSVAIGYMARATASRSIRLGSTNSADYSALYSIHDISTSSDVRDKTDIKPITKALDFLRSLETIQYVDNSRMAYASENLTPEQEQLREKYTMHQRLYDSESHAKGECKGQRKRVGVSAQDVQEKMMKIYGTDNYAELVHDNLYDRNADGEEFPDGVESLLSVNYTRFIPFLISAIQEMAERLEKVEEKTGKQLD